MQPNTAAPRVRAAIPAPRSANIDIRAMRQTDTEREEHAA